MSTELERLVALVTCVNVYLQDDETKINLEPTIAEYCHGFEFINNPFVCDDKTRVGKQIIATDASKWFVHLKKQGPLRVRLHYRPSIRDDVPVGILTISAGCGSNWLVETQYNQINRLYVNILNPRVRGISQPWKTFFALLEGACLNLEDTSPSVDESRKVLDQLLEELSDFAGRFEWSKHWVYTFNKSRKILDEFEPSESDNLVPPGIYSKEARQLLQAALGSWIFGGMSSWNDLAFRGKAAAQYSSLSKQLYETICKSISSVVNSYP